MREFAIARSGDGIGLEANQGFAQKVAAGLKVGDYGFRKGEFPTELDQLTGQDC
jgi:hypothetical protein